MKRKKGRKFNAVKCEYDGIQFDSETERDYYIYLKSRTDILEIEPHPVFDIIPPHTIVCERCRGTGRTESVKTGNPIKCSLCAGTGERERSGAMYTADFRVTYSNGYVEIVDVKGFSKTTAFMLRKKLLESQTGREVIVVRRVKNQWVRDAR